MMLFFFQFLIVFSWISASNCCSLWENFVEVQSCIVNNFYRSSIFFFCLIWSLSSSNQVLFYPCVKWKCIPGKKNLSHNVYISLFFQGSVPAPRGSDVGEHATAVKPNGGHVSYSDTSAATSVNGKTSSEEFDHIIQSMAQVKSKPRQSLRCLCAALVECQCCNIVKIVTFPIDVFLFIYT